MLRLLEFSDVLKLGNDVDQLWLAYRREDEFVTNEVPMDVPQVQVSSIQVEVAECAK